MDNEKWQCAQILKSLVNENEYGGFMAKLEKVSIYFMKPGSENTDSVVEAVARRVKEGGIETVVVASTSGKTGVKFAEALKDKAHVIAISYRKMNPELKEGIVNLGGVVVDETHLPLHGKDMDDVRNTLYILGQGFKVAVEVILIAADKGLIELCRDVIGVGGSGKGADTAIVARSTTTKKIFSEDSSKRLEVRELIAMPLKKKWW
jgi:hypothetical protein